MNEVRAEQRRAAQRRFVRHIHSPSDHDPMTRDNCGACLLNGYHGRGEKRNDINYAGWARLYVQAGKAIPSVLFEAFLNELDDDNRVYADALKDDIRFWGLTVTGKNAGKFKSLVMDKVGCFLY